MTHHIAQNLHVGKRLLLFAAAVSALATPIVFGMVRAPQNPAQSQTKTYRFEVASIKRVREERSGGGSGFRGGRFTATNATVKGLVSRAFGVQQFQISGGPSWIESDRYDIEAKAEGEVPSGPFLNPEDNPLSPMVRGLLEERFKLKLHRESKEMPTYALVVAKGGPKLAQLNADDASRPGSIRLGLGELVASKVPISFLINYLSGQVNRVVVDKTGLTGQYDLKLTWSREQPLGLGLGAPGRGGAVASPTIDPNAPTLFSAIEDQLGLKLESTRGPVEFIVIDSVEKPSEN